MIGVKMIRVRKFTLIAGLVFIFCLFYPKKIFAQSVVINEFSISPSDKQDWIELYSVSEDVDVSNWKVGDEAGIFFTFPSDTKLSAGSFYVISKYQRLNNDKDTIYLYKDDGSLVDFIRYGYENEVCISSSEGSIARVPDGSNNINRLARSTKGFSNGDLVTDPCPVMTPTPFISPSPVSNPVAVAKVNIAKPRDMNGNTMDVGSFKIYIDGNYTGNYTPQTYTFGDGKTCGSNNVPCGFGVHTFKVEKTGYIPWAKTVEITAGNNYEFDPVLLLSSPTNTPIVKPTVTATVSATPKSTLASFSTSTESGLLAEDVFSKESVLGAESYNMTPIPSAENVAVDPKFKAAILFLITAGISFLASAVYAFIRSRKKKRQDGEKANEMEESA